MYLMAGINHNIDELLVGVIKQIRLREGKKERKKETKVKCNLTLKIY